MLKPDQRSDIRNHKMAVWEAVLLSEHQQLCQTFLVFLKLEGNDDYNVFLPDRVAATATVSLNTKLFYIASRAAECTDTLSHNWIVELCSAIP